MQCDHVYWPGHSNMNSRAPRAVDVRDPMIMRPMRVHISITPRSHTETHRPVHAYAQDRQSWPFCNAVLAIFPTRPRVFSKFNLSSRPAGDRLRVLVPVGGTRTHSPLLVKASNSCEQQCFTHIHECWRRALSRSRALLRAMAQATCGSGVVVIGTRSYLAR